VTLVEYGDYDCPYTVRAYAIVRGLRKRMGDRMRFVFRPFPLTEIHAHAQAAAEVAESAAAQGRFWEMHDKLFDALRKLEDKDQTSSAMPKRSISTWIVSRRRWRSTRTSEAAQEPGERPRERGARDTDVLYQRRKVRRLLPSGCAVGGDRGRAREDS
jgi:hypothetical protein